MSLKKIKDLFHYEKGSLQSTKATPGEYDFITAAADWKTHNEFTHDCEALIFAAAASGSLGRTHYVNGKFISSDLCFIITPKDPDKYPIDMKFYHLLFLAFKDEIVRNTKSGTSKEAIGLRVFGNYELPYFDIDKQLETRKLFVHAQESSDKIESELTHQLDLVKQLRQAFLREAMQGELVPQVSNDESASVLLGKIKAEKERLIKEKKIRKEKALPPILDEEIPFEIPQNWKWCRLGELASFLNGYAFKSSWYTDVGIPVLRNINMGVGEIIWKDVAKIPDSLAQDFSEYLLNIGDILLSLDRPIINAGLKVAQVTKKDLPCLLLQRVLKTSPILSYKDYVFVWFQSELFISSINPGRSIGIPHVSHKDVAKALIPLPPLSEQQRIVAKLDELMKFCDHLEANIIDSQQQNELLLKQVLTEELGLKIQEVEQSPIKASKAEQKTRKFDPNTTLMEIVALLKMHGKLHAEELWKMSKFYGKAEEDRDIDGFYAELKKLIEKEKTIKEAEKGYLELV